MKVNGWLIAWLGVLASSWDCTDARADWLFFAQGGQAELPVEVHGTTVDVFAPSGRISFPRSSFRAIVACESQADAWRRRFEVAERTHTAEARFNAAWWALEHGLTSEAVAMFRIAASAPGAAQHAPLGRVARILDQLDQPRSDPDLRAVEQILSGSGWNRVTSDHIVLLHQASSNDAADRLDVINRVLTTYYVSLAAQGIELPVPRRRLISVWFARQMDYIATLRRIEAAPFATTTQGYYQPNFGVVFAFDTRTSSDQAVVRQKLLNRRSEAPSPASQTAEFNRQSLLLEMKWRSVDLGIAAHETVHQLVAASGLVANFDNLPIWFHEGFSAQFEVVRGGQWAGMGRINDQRLPDWRAINHAPSLAPLLRDSGLTHGYHRDRYSESWALVYFLRKARPSEFIEYLNLLRNPQKSDQSDHVLSAFYSVFGQDLNQIESDMRSFLNSQVLPHESVDTFATGGKSRQPKSRLDFKP